MQQSNSDSPWQSLPLPHPPRNTQHRVGGAQDCAFARGLVTLQLLGNSELIQPSRTVRGQELRPSCRHTETLLSDFPSGPVQSWQPKSQDVEHKDMLVSQDRG